MSWVKLDDGFYDHEKFDGLDLAAVGLWAIGLAYANRNRTDGLVRSGFVSRVATKKQVRALCDAGLWADCDDGYAIHNYLKHQNSAEQIEALSRIRAENGSKGGSKSQAKPKQIAKQNGSKPEAKAKQKEEVEKEEEENNQPPSPPSSPDELVRTAARLLAASETERRKPQLGNPGGYLQSRIEPIRREHEPLWREILQREPGTTAQQLADVIEPPPKKRFDECVECGWLRSSGFAHPVVHDPWAEAQRPKVEYPRAAPELVHDLVQSLKLRSVS